MLTPGDTVVMGTLYVGGRPVKVPAKPMDSYYGGDLTNYEGDYGHPNSDNTDKITLRSYSGNTDYQMKAIYVGDGVFVCDRCMLRITWNKLHAALPAGRDTVTPKEGVKLRVPSVAEYDKLCDVTNESNDLMHWNMMLSWTTQKSGSSTHQMCGYKNARNSVEKLNRDGYPDGGFRPAFKLTNPNDYANLKPGDTTVIGTLYMGKIPIKVPSNPIGINKGGDIIQYRAGNAMKIALGEALDDPTYQMKAIYVGDGVFICDRVMLVRISFEQLDAALR